MGLTCMAANCAGQYICCANEEYQGNIIFKSINTNLILEGEQFSEEEKIILNRCENLLKQSEEERLKIADKFRELLVNTGACILKKPTLERAVISFIIYLFEQIIFCAKKKSVEFDKNDFAITNFIKISKESPFVSFNQETLNNLKSKYGFDINRIETLNNSQKSLISFLSTIIETKNVIVKQYELIKGLIMDLRNNLSLVKKVTQSLEGIKFILNYFSELTKSFFLAQQQLQNPRKIELFFKIAQKAAEKNISDPKELVLIYSLGDNCGSVTNYEENLGYKKVELYKY